MRVLGIDPGATGAIALYSPGVKMRKGPPGLAIPDIPAQLSIWDLPFNEVLVGKTKRKRVDKLGLLELLDEISIYGPPDRVLIEEVAAMPKQSGMFAFGYGVGALHMAFISRKIPFEVIRPAVWKPAIKVPKDKKQAVVRAEELMPQWRHMWRYRADNGKDATQPDRAEAALIAFYGATVTR